MHDTTGSNRQPRREEGFAFRVHGTEARVDQELELLQAKYREEGMEVVVERVLSTMAVVIAPKSPWEVL